MCCISISISHRIHTCMYMHMYVHGLYKHTFSECILMHLILVATDFLILDLKLHTVKTLSINICITHIIIIVHITHVHTCTDLTCTCMYITNYMYMYMYINFTCLSIPVRKFVHARALFGRYKCTTVLAIQKLPRILNHCDYLHVHVAKHDSCSPSCLFPPSVEHACSRWSPAGC